MTSRQLITALLALAFSLCNVYAQSTKKIDGFVLDATAHSPVVGASVQVLNTGHGTYTDHSGYFEIENVPQGRYVVEIRCLGYQSETVQNISVSTESTTSLHIKLTRRILPIDSVEVTASYESLDLTASAASIITREELDAQKSLGLAGVMNQVAGVQVESDGGNSARVRIHNSMPGQVLVLVDGQRLNDPQSGEANLNQIPIDIVERVEIHRYGNSAEFGGNAFAGVVNIITRKPERGLNGFLTASAGSYDFAAGSINASGQNNTFGWVVHYDQNYTRQRFPYTYEGETLHRENNWARNRNVFTRFSVNSKQSNITILFQRNAFTQALPSSFFEENLHHNAQRVGAASTIQVESKLLFEPLGFVQARLGQHTIDDVFDNEADPSPYTRYKTEQQNRVRESEFNLHIEKQRVQFFSGIQLLQERLDQKDLLYSARSIGRKQRDRVGTWVSTRITALRSAAGAAQLQFLGAARVEKYFQLEKRVLPSVSTIFAPLIIPQIVFSAGYAESLNYPDFNSLFWVGDARSAGNPDLVPEERKNWRAGIRTQFRQKYAPQLEATWHSANIKNLIFWHRGQNGVWQPRNEVAVSQSGIDLDLSQPLVSSLLTVKLGYAYLKSINNSSEVNYAGNDIVFSPRHTFHSTLVLTSSWLDLSIIHRHVSAREIVMANTGEALEPYRLFDASLSLTRKILRSNLTLSMSVRNLGDEQYQLIRGYPMPGKQFLISTKISALKRKEQL